MKKEENEEYHDEKNNFRETRISQSKEKDSTYNKTSKTFNMLPSLGRANNISFRTSFNFNKNNSGGSILNQKDYDPNLLKKQLSLYKADMHNKKNELLKLKIKYSKLYEENFSNKNLISSILGISLDKYLTREAVLDKIEHCELSDDERKKLQEAYDIIKLKLEISEKKEKISQQNNYKEELIKNSKTKIINELKSDYLSKCEKQRKVIRNLEKLEEKYAYLEKEIKKNDDIIEELKKNRANLKAKDNESKNQYDNKVKEKDNLLKQNRQLDEKIKKQIISNRENYKKNYDCEKAIKDLEEILKEINDYKSERNEYLKIIEKKKKIVEDSDKIKKEQNNKIKELEKESDELTIKMRNYDNERPKLIAKAREPKSEIDHKISLENELKKLNKEKEETIKKYEEKQNQLKIESENEKKNNQMNKDIIKKNNLQKEDLNGKIAELEKKINEIDEKNKSLKENINNKQNDFSILLKEEENIKIQNEQNNINYEEEQKKNKEDKNKEQNKKKNQYKKELETLKNEQQNLTKEKNNIKIENENYANLNEKYDKELEKYDEFETQLKKAKEELDNLKIKK